MLNKTMKLTLGMMTGFFMLVLFTACESADKKTTETTVDADKAVITAPAPAPDTMLRNIDTTVAPRPLKPGN